jgi:hypothetical protein
LGRILMKKLADRLLHRFTNHETALNAGHHCDFSSTLLFSWFLHPLEFLSLENGF